MAAGSQESSEQQPAAVERQARLRLDLFSYPRYKPPYDNSQHGDTNKRMGNTTMVFQVGDTILQTGKDVDVRSVGGQNQRQRGETCLTVQPRLADGDRGQGVDNVTHTLTAVAISQTGLNRKTRFATLTLILAANAPDIDILSSLKDSIPYLKYHRGISHSFIGITVLAIIIW